MGKRVVSIQIDTQEGGAWEWDQRRTRSTGGQPSPITHANADNALGKQLTSGVRPQEKQLLLSRYKPRHAVWPIHNSSPPGHSSHLAPVVPPPPLLVRISCIHLTSAYPLPLPYLAMRDTIAPRMCVGKSSAPSVKTTGIEPPTPTLSH